MRRRPISARARQTVLERQWHELGPAADPGLAYCVYCTEEGEVAWGYGPRLVGLEWDHVVPVARGGTNDPENLVIACGPCNRSKGAKLWISEWLDPIARFG